MARILIVFSTTDGHTVKICERLKRTIEQESHTVEVISVGDCGPVDLQSFDKIVIGASIRYGKHSKRVYDFIDSNLPLLDGKANAFFSVNIVARKPEKNRPETNPYIRQFLRKTSWRPKKLGVFAGKLNYPIYGFVDRLMIRFIMLMTQGPTDPATVVEFTDWEQVDAFARHVSSM